MFTQLAEGIKNAIGQAWDVWFDSLRVRALSFENSDLSKSEVYRQAATEAYWKGASDMLEIVGDAEWVARELRSRHKHPLPSPWAELLDETH